MSSGPALESFLAYRGGGWRAVVQLSRVSVRLDVDPSHPDRFLSLRLARRMS